MIKSLHLKRFKNFQDAMLTLGPLTILVGANASGKSNIRDAFLFLHGVGRGYRLAEILGEKYLGGNRVWSGIRGGTREVAYFDSDSFEVGVDLQITSADVPVQPDPVQYQIEVSVAQPAARGPRILDEFLRYPHVFGKSITVKGKTGFSIHDRVRVINGRVKTDKDNVKVSFLPVKRTRVETPTICASDSPILFQIGKGADGNGQKARVLSRFVVDELNAFRFLDPSPAQMRIPSLPGQTTLGDRGENLSSVLLAICQAPKKKEALLEWIRKLTPMDVVNLQFDPDASGRTLLSLKEKNGQTVSADCASDGTLRFLGILAAMFGPDPATVYFIEELENGIHPTRLGLLVELIESQTKRRGIQVIATSHSPQLLQFLSEESIEHASLVYRLPDHPDARIKRILEIPDARRVINEQPVSLLHASSWFEDVLDFDEDVGSAPTAGKQRIS